MGKRLLSFLVVCLCAVSMAFAQKSITGVVIDASTGEPVVGASVMLSGTTTGAATDLNGKFTINNVPANAKRLRVTYIGMNPVEVAAKNNVRILMQPTDQSLDEVMVVAYGTMKKSSFTGSAAEIKAEDISAHVSTSISSALSGSTAGVQLTSSNADPAEESTSIRVRGIGSINASNSPLIIVDGMPYEGVLSNINPQDVESMTVLKDAAASAIYGARGANGVILITTKRGSKKDAEIHFDAKWGSSSIGVPRYDLINDPGEYYETAYRQLYNSKIYSGSTKAEAYAFANSALIDRNNGGLGYLVYTVPEGENLIGTNFKLNPNAKLGYSDGEYYYTPDDWYDATYKNSFRQEYNLSVSGATDRFNYYASVGMLDQDGITNQSDFKRYTARTNVDYQVKKWFKVGANLNYTHSDFQQPDYTTLDWGSSGNIFYFANNMGPIYPLYVRNADGSIKHDENGLVVYDSNQTNQQRPSFTGNAFRDNEYDRSHTYRDMINGNWSAIFTPLEGLTLTARIGFNSDNRRSTNLYSTFGNMTAYDGGAAVTNIRQFSVNNQYLANYVTDFGTDATHNLDILAGYEQFKYKYQYLYGFNTHLYNPLIGEINNAHGPGADKTVSSYTNNYMIEGIFGRAQYDYKEKYVASFSLRRDASSRFHKDHRWGTFYSFGLAWNMAKESFMESAEWVDLLKVKLSYGEQGNDDLASADYPYQPYADVYEVSYDDNTGSYATVLQQLGNEELTWEKNRNFNIGVDFGFWKSRLSGSIEYFNRSTSDLLYYLNQPLSSGFGRIRKPVNVGSIRNRGVELTVNAVPVRTKDFTWDINLNLTHYKNKITELDPSVPEEGIKTGTSIRRVGGSLYQAYAYKRAGIYTEDNFCDEVYDPMKAGMAMYYYEHEVEMKDAEGNVIKDENGKAKTEVFTDRTTDFSKASMYDCGDVLPKLQGGLGTTLSFKGFDLSAQFAFQLGGKMYDSGYQALMHTQSTSVGMAWHKDALDSWSPENPKSSIPRLDATYAESQSTVDAYYKSSNYLSLNNLTLGYTFPKLMMSNLGIETLRIYVAGENLLLLTARKGMDPRFNFGIGGYTSGAAYASGNYSPMRTITAGLTLQF